MIHESLITRREDILGTRKDVGEGTDDNGLVGIATSALEGGAGSGLVEQCNRIAAKCVGAAMDALRVRAAVIHRREGH